jgi:hypothetical protein
LEDAEGSKYRLAVGHAISTARSAYLRYRAYRREFDGLRRRAFLTYLRLLDADAEGADWQEVAKIVLHIDPEREPDRAKRAWESHLTGAKWMTENGFRHLLRGGAPH